jgi:hypothetical protein
MVGKAREMMTTALTESDVRTCTVKDVARLAGGASNGIARRKRYLQCLPRSENESINYRLTVAISSQ